MGRTFGLGLWVLAGVVAFGCGGGHDGMMMGPGEIPSGVSPAPFLSVSPNGGASGVSLTTMVVVRFGAAMGAEMEEYVDLHEGGLSGPVSPMSCTWSADRRTLSCTPGAPLQPGTTYWIHLGGGLMDEVGDPVDYDEYGPMMGGEWIQGGMMGGSHAGGPWGMMGGAWHDAHGGYGMAFPFTTA
jgi:hypothetical protein